MTQEQRLLKNIAEKLGVLYELEQTQGSVPEAPNDGTSYVRNSLTWKAINPEIAFFLNYTKFALSAPFSTSSTTPQEVFTLTFTAEPTEIYRLDIIFDYFITSTSQQMKFDFRVNGTDVYSIVKEAKDNSEVSILSPAISVGAGTPAPLLSGNNTVALYASKDSGAAAVTINRGGAIAMRTF